MVLLTYPVSPSLDGERIMRVDKTDDDTFTLSEVIRSHVHSFRGYSVKGSAALQAR